MSMQEIEVMHQGDDRRNDEYEVFAKVTARLVAVENQNPADRDWRDALDNNRRLWLALQDNLFSNENRLPDPLKAQLISLAIWVEKHTAKVIQGDADATTLISVNQSIMEGLAA